MKSGEVKPRGRNNSSESLYEVALTEDSRLGAITPFSLEPKFHFDPAAPARWSLDLDHQARRSSKVIDSPMILRRNEKAVLDLSDLCRRWILQHAKKSICSAR